MPPDELQGLVAAAKSHQFVDPIEFARIVFEHSGVAAAAPKEEGSYRDVSSPAFERFVLAAIPVLARALEVNPDETRVLQWFNNERIKPFAARTPAEIVASGMDRELLVYLESIDAGSSG